MQGAPTIFRRLIPWTIKLTLLAALLFTIIYLHQSTTNLRQRISQQNFSAQSTINSANQKKENESELSSKSQDIAVIQSTIISSQADLLPTLSNIEKQASQINVSIQIPEITEHVMADKSDQSENVDPTIYAEAKIIAHGTPTDLITFLHQIEYSEQVLIIENWRLTTNSFRDHQTLNSDTLHLAELQLELLIPLINTSQ